nr:inovirus-type Gp2 protein [uncultured Albidiferax sp.]
MNHTTKKRAASALLETAIAYTGNTENTQIILYEEFFLTGRISEIENITSKIGQSNDELFSVRKSKFNGNNYIHSKNIGRLFLETLKINTLDIKRYYPLHELNPNIDLYIRTVQSTGVDELARIYQSGSTDETTRWVALLNGCIGLIRTEAQSYKFKKTLCDFQRSSNKNSRELEKYTNALFEQHSRLLVLRVDFSYAKEYCGPPGITGSIQYSDVKTHRENLFKYINSNFSEGVLVGYSWKLEYGLEKSFHYHVILFFDGSKVREDVTIARIIGETWNTKITGGKGLYFNCNSKKENYKSCGIGMLHHSNSEMREGLKKATIYMTKTDYYIKMAAKGLGRTFGKGIMPKLKIKPMGRPRKNKTDQTDSLKNIH